MEEKAEKEECSQEVKDMVEEGREGAVRKHTECKAEVPDKEKLVVNSLAGVPDIQEVHMAEVPDKEKPVVNSFAVFLVAHHLKIDF